MFALGGAAASESQQSHEFGECDIGWEDVDGGVAVVAERRPRLVGLREQRSQFRISDVDCALSPQFPELQTNKGVSLGVLLQRA